jgi:hypothetical protein
VNDVICRVSSHFFPVREKGKKARGDYLQQHRTPVYTILVMAAEAPVIELGTKLNALWRDNDWRTCVVVDVCVCVCACEESEKGRC